MSTNVVRSFPNSRNRRLAGTALAGLVLVLAACSGGGGGCVGADPNDVGWLSGYTGVYRLRFTNPAEQYSDSGTTHLSIFNLSCKKFLGIVKTPADTVTTGVISGSIVAPGMISITQFGDGKIGIRDFLLPVANRCNAGAAVVSPLTGGMHTDTLVVSGTVTMPCQYPAGTYSTVANFTIWAPIQPDLIPCYSARPPGDVIGVSLAVSCSAVLPLMPSS